MLSILFKEIQTRGCRQFPIDKLIMKMQQQIQSVGICTIKNALNVHQNNTYLFGSRLKNVFMENI